MEFEDSGTDDQDLSAADALVQEVDARNRAVTEEDYRHLDNHQAELSGTKAGYIYTTGAAAEDSRPGIRAKKARTADAEVQLTALQALMADPGYAALFSETLDTVTQAQIVAEATMAVAEGALAEAEDNLFDLQDNAAKLVPSGERVYRDADGNVYAEDGRRLSDTEAASVVFPKDAPSYEEFLAKQKALQDALDRIDAIRRHQDRLGSYQDRLTDQDNPLTPDELRDIQDDIEAGLTSAGNIRPDEVPTATATMTADIVLPPPSS